MPVEGEDNYAGIQADVRIGQVHVKAVVGIDTLSGFEQDLDYPVDGDGVTVDGVVVRDYPLLLRLEIDA